MKIILLLALTLASHAWGAANLLITSAVLAANGQSMTVTMSAGTLAPASGITGCFTMSGGNVNSNVVGSASTSGSTVTFQLGAPPDRTNTLTIAIATAGAGCPLTSNGVDTPTGQSGISVTNGSEWYGCASPGLANSARYDGGALINVDSYVLGYPNLCEWNSAGGGLTVTATGSEIQVWQFDYNNAYSLYQDGVAIGSRVKKGAVTAFSVASLATGLSGSHSYQIVNSAGQSSFQTVLIALVRFVGGAPSGTPPAALPLIGGCGDSIVGSGSSPDDTTTVNWLINGLTSGLAAQIYTASGALVSTTLRDACGTRSVPFSATSPAVWILQGGVNDMAAGVAIGNNTTPGTFQGDYVTMIRNVQTNAHPPTKLLVRGILPCTYTNCASIATYVNAQEAAVNYVNATFGTSVCFYRTTSWISSTPFGAYPLDTSDGLHPNGHTTFAGNGYSKIANREAPLYAGYTLGSSFTFTGPTSGASGVASTNFTVTLRDSATFQQALTLTDGGQGGTFTTAFGSGVSPLTITPTGSSWTFTYTPASGGTKNLTFTGLPDCWTAPASINYVSSSSPQSVNVTSSCNILIPQFCPIVTLPASAPWTTLGSASYKITTRMHVSSGTVSPLLIVGPMKILVGGGSIAITPVLAAPLGDSLGVQYPSDIACCTGRTDILIKLQRDVPNLRWVLRVCNTIGTSCQTVNYPITLLGTQASYAGQQIIVGGTDKIAFLRVFSTIDAATDTIRNAGVTGDLANFEFESNMVDSVSGLALTGAGVTVAYSNTPSYSPYCDAGTQQTFKTGIAGTLNGSQSQALNNASTLTYLWTQAPTGTDGVVQTLGFGTATAASTTVSGYIKGSVNTILTVTDGAAQSTPCTIHNGAVTVNANDVVITGLPSHDKILKKMLRYGSPNNRAPFYDVANKMLVDLQGAALTTNFPNYWDTFIVGSTVSVSPVMSCGGSGLGFGLVGSAAATFTTTFAPGDYVVIAYNAGANRLLNQVISTPSNTCMILRYIWPTGTTESGLSYVHPDTDAVNRWGYAQVASPGNYYDNFKGYRSFYERSGIDTYWTYWEYVDVAWAMPAHDKGQAYRPPPNQSPLVFIAPRNQSLEGMMLRALDPGKSAMDAQIGIAITSDIAQLAQSAAAGWVYVDTRESAYLTNFTALYAQLGLDAGIVAASKAALSSAVAGLYASGLNANGSIPSLELTIVDTTHSALVNTGTTLVTCPSCNFVAGMTHPVSNVLYGTFPASAPYFVTYPVFDGTTPVNNAAFNPTVYTATVASTTTLTISPPYVGPSGTVGWATDADSQTVDNKYAIGWMCQPFMCGIQAAALAEASRAIAVSDPTNAALAASLASSIANYLTTRGYADPAFSGVGGMYYYQDALNCAFPTQTPACTLSYTASSSRTDASEVVRGLTETYLLAPTATKRTFLNTLVDQMFCKIGYGAGTTCAYDGFYINDLDEGGTFMTSAFQASKWLGFFFGWSSPINWLAENAEAPSPTTGIRPPSTQRTGTGVRR